MNIVICVRFITVVFLGFTLFGCNSLDKGRWEYHNKRTLELLEQKEYKLALREAEKSYKLSEKKFGSLHYNTAISIQSIATVYLLVGQYDKAEKHYLESLEIMKTENKYSEMRVLIGMAVMYELTNNIDKANKIYTDALEIIKRKNNFMPDFYKFEIERNISFYKHLGLDVTMKPFKNELKNNP